MKLPNASLLLLPEAGARHEQTLEAVSGKALLGPERPEPYHQKA
jgi:hypothetical protein